MKRLNRSTSPRLLSSNELRATTGGGMFSAAVKIVKDALSSGDGGGTGGGGDGYMQVQLEDCMVSSV